MGFSPLTKLLISQEYQLESKGRCQGCHSASVATELPRPLRVLGLRQLPGGLARPPAWTAGSWSLTEEMAETGH